MFMIIYNNNFKIFDNKFSILFKISMEYYIIVTIFIMLFYFNSPEYKIVCILSKYTFTYI